VLKSDPFGGNWFVQSGTVSPLSGFAVPAPPGPTHAAMTDSFGPGSHVLYQDFTVPANASSGSISFALFIGNRNGLFYTPNSLDPSVFPNQQARVDLITTGADPFSVASGDVLLNLYQTHVGDPAISGYTTHTIDLTALLTAHKGQTLRLRFAEVDNQFYFQFGVDQVNLVINVGAGPSAAGPTNPAGASGHGTPPASKGAGHAPLGAALPGAGGSTGGQGWTLSGVSSGNAGGHTAGGGSAPPLRTAGGRGGTVVSLTAVPPAPGPNTPSGLTVAAPTGGRVRPTDTVFALKAPPGESSNLFGYWLAAPGEGGADAFGLNDFFPEPFLPPGGAPPLA
jgi:hypothetical protein